MLSTLSILHTYYNWKSKTLSSTLPPHLAHARYFSASSEKSQSLASFIRISPDKIAGKDLFQYTLSKVKHLEFSKTWEESYIKVSRQVLLRLLYTLVVSRGLK